MVHDSGMMPWIHELGLNGHPTLNGHQIFLANPDDVLQLDGGPAHEDMSRGKRVGDSIGNSAPSKRPARNLDYGVSELLENHEALQGMLRLNSGSLDSPHAKARQAVLQAPDGATSVGGSRFLACVAGGRDDDDPPHSPPENESVLHTPSSSGPRWVLISVELKLCANRCCTPPLLLLSCTWLPLKRRSYACPHTAHPRPHHLSLQALVITSFLLLLRIAALLFFKLLHAIYPSYFAP
jgi:hypothetical protein